MTREGRVVPALVSHVCTEDRSSKGALGEIAPAFAAAVDIVIAYLRNSTCSYEQVGTLLRDVHSVALGAVLQEDKREGDREAPHHGAPADRRNAGEALVPAVSVEDSVTDEFLICLEDGKRVKSLKRYLNAHYSMSTEQYRLRWKLPADYPFVAPALSRKRSLNAKQINLHRFGNVARAGG